MIAVENNRRLYDKVADRYDKADGRRDKLRPWAEKQIRAVLNMCKDDPGYDLKLLDIGAGTGFISNIAACYCTVTALDVSQAMLDKIRDTRINKVLYDGGKLPFPDNSFDAVVTFATLHHIDGVYSLFTEIYRVLKPGGVYYSDHDLEALFYRKHRGLINIYRAIRNAPRRFGVNPALYDAAEIYDKGLEGDTLRLYIDKIFNMSSIAYHWNGIAPFRAVYQFRDRGKAPLIRIVARKRRGDAKRV